MIVDSLRGTEMRPRLSPQWRLARMTQPRGLASANGLRIGPEGALYVVSAFGSEIARLDPDAGTFSIVSPRGDGIASPDDLAFDSSGLMFVTECMDARVSALDSRGQTRIVADELPGANGITVSKDRIFITECRPSGRLLEVFDDGRRPSLMAENLALPNGMCVGPDERIYFVQVYSGEIVRMPVDGGAREVFASGLEVPSSVRLGPDGWIWCSQGHTGEVTRLDPASGQRETAAQARPGIDNLDISPDGRLFLSYYIDGQVIEVSAENGTRELVPAGLLAPYGLAWLDGTLHVADGMKSATVARTGEVEVGGKFTDEGFPGYVIGASACGALLCVTTTDGRVSLYDPSAGRSEVLVEGLHEPVGIAALPDGVAVAAEAGRGRVVEVRADGSIAVLAQNLGRPVGVAVAPDGSCFVSDEKDGKVLRITQAGDVMVVRGDLQHPHGLAVHEDTVYVLEAGAQNLLALPVAGGGGESIASDLPVGAGGGKVHAPLGGLPELVPGPMSPFAGLAADPEGCLYVGADAVGAVLVLEPAR